MSQVSLDRDLGGESFPTLDELGHPTWENEFCYVKLPLSRGNAIQGFEDQKTFIKLLAQGLLPIIQG